MEDALTETLLEAQRNELTEHHIYARLARSVKDPHNRQVLEGISQDELRHYETWKRITGRDVRPKVLKIWWFYIVGRLLGFTFAVKLMEAGEGAASENYGGLTDLPEAEQIVREEDEHEDELIQMLDEERLKYTGAIVIGLNDALVELTGALAGFTLAFGRPRVVAMAGIITGISASLSMAGSEYLATKSEGGELSPGRAAFYTGMAYSLTVALLIAPYLLFSSVYVCLGLMVTAALAVIAVFNFYMAVAKDMNFTRAFLEMATISLGIAALTFGIGALVRRFLRVDV